MVSLHFSAPNFCLRANASTDVCHDALRIYKPCRAQQSPTEAPQKKQYFLPITVSTPEHNAFSIGSCSASPARHGQPSAAPRPSQCAKPSCLFTPWSGRHCRWPTERRHNLLRFLPVHLDHYHNNHPDLDDNLDAIRRVSDSVLHIDHLANGSRRCGRSNPGRGSRSASPDHDRDGDDHEEEARRSSRPGKIRPVVGLQLLFYPHTHRDRHRGYRMSDETWSNPLANL